MLECWKLVKDQAMSLSQALFNTDASFKRLKKHITLSEAKRLHLRLHWFDLAKIDTTFSCSFWRRSISQSIYLTSSSHLARCSIAPLRALSRRSLPILLLISSLCLIDSIVLTYGEVYAKLLMHCVAHILLHNRWACWPHLFNLFPRHLASLDQCWIEILAA